jgi:hypothetical protein
MKLLKFRNVLFVLVSGGALLQAGGCEATAGSLVASLLPQLLIGALTGFFGI